MSWRPAATTTTPASPSRGRALTRRIADYFGLSYPHEFTSAASLLIALIFLRVITVTHYKFAIDEPQHLHVVWGWARGFVQYRDLADNHMPLFQILCAPIYKLIGDRGTILYWMRIILQPLYIVAFWCTYRIGSLLFSRRVGVWAAILVGLSFDYAFCSVEFRTDNLWAPLWLLCLSVLLGGALTMRRALIAGFLMGLCFGVSMKTLLLVMSTLIGGSMTLIFVGRERLGIGWGQILARVGSVLRQRVDCSCYDHGRVCALWHLAAVPLLGFRSQRRARFEQPSRMVGDYLCCRIPARRSRGASDCRRDARGRGGGAPEFCLCHGRLLLYRAPFLLALSVAAGLPPLLSARLCHLYGRSSDDFGPLGYGIEISRRSGVSCPCPPWFGVCELLVALLAHPFWEDKAKLESDLLRDTLKLTEPGDFVFDRRGEMVFRQRCFYPIIETFTEERIRRGLMEDNAIQRCIDTRTCVAVLPGAHAVSHVPFSRTELFADWKQIAGGRCPVAFIHGREAL